MKAKEIGCKIYRGIMDNKETIGVVALSAGMILLSWKLGIPLYGGGTSNYSRNWTDEIDETCNRAISGIFMPRNSKQTKIVALSESAMKAYFDSDKTRIAKDIFEIVKDSEDDDDKRFAIMALRDISKKLDFDSGKRVIADLIKKV